MAVTSQSDRRTSDWPCGERLERAAHFVSQVRAAPTRGAALRAAASREGLTAVAATLRSLPVVPAAFSDTPVGEELRRWFRPDRRLPLNRAPVAVLDLPSTYAEYLRGRARQALRTNLTRAAEAGLSCRAVHDERDLRIASDHLAARRGQSSEFLVPPGVGPGPHRLFSVARDAAGEPVALSQTIVDGSWAGLISMVSATGHGEAPLVRYALHAHLVEVLIDRGVTRMVVGGSMLLTSPGTRYFQRRTGFAPVWLHPAPVPAAVRGAPPSGIGGPGAPDPAAPEPRRADSDGPGRMCPWPGPASSPSH